MEFIDFFDLIAPFLSREALCKLAQTSQNINKATTAIEESLFGSHEWVKTINKSVMTSMGALCTHISSDGERKAMFVPLPFGHSSKAKLRAIVLHKEIWKSYGICVRVHLQDPQSLTGKEELLFVTKKYSEEMCARFIRY
jgi:hypothetical protein